MPKLNLNDLRNDYSESYFTTKGEKKGLKRDKKRIQHKLNSLSAKRENKSYEKIY